MDEISFKVDAATSEALALGFSNQSIMAATKPLKRGTRVRVPQKQQPKRSQNIPPRSSANPTLVKSFPPALLALCDVAREECEKRGWQ